MFKKSIMFLLLVLMLAGNFICAEDNTVSVQRSDIEKVQPSHINDEKIIRVPSTDQNTGQKYNLMGNVKKAEESQAIGVIKNTK